MELFQSLDPGGFGVLTAPMLRLLVGELSLCDYRELLRSELGNFSASLAAADVNADLKVGRVEAAGNSWEPGGC